MSGRGELLGGSDQLGNVTCPHHHLDRGIDGGGFSQWLTGIELDALILVLERDQVHVDEAVDSLSGEVGTRPDDPGQPHLGSSSATRARSPAPNASTASGHSGDS